MLPTPLSRKGGLETALKVSAARWSHRRRERVRRRSNL